MEQTMSDENSWGDDTVGIGRTAPRPTRDTGRGAGRHPRAGLPSRRTLVEIAVGAILLGLVAVDRLADESVPPETIEKTVRVEVPVRHRPIPPLRKPTDPPLGQKREERPSHANVTNPGRPNTQPH
ncbi:MAG TPA: hypothetical protein VGV69_10445, partial [Solirubrobacterales bacterium]|nr:hypothetical protein [Solirubrobacterales bacterium]